MREEWEIKGELRDGVLPLFAQGMPCFAGCGTSSRRSQEITIDRSITKLDIEAEPKPDLVYLVDDETTVLVLTWYANRTREMCDLSCLPCSREGGVATVW